MAIEGGLIDGGHDGTRVTMMMKNKADRQERQLKKIFYFICSTFLVFFWP